MYCHSKPMRPLTSIVSYPERGEGGDNRYRGNCSPKLIEDLIGVFKPKRYAIICAEAAQPKQRLIKPVFAVISTTCTAGSTL